MIGGLVVRVRELEAVIGDRPFLALPKEEVARLYGTVQLHEGSASDAADPGLLSVGTVTVVHRNYVWQTFTADEAGLPGRSLGLASPCLRAKSPAVFLDDDLSADSRRTIAPRLETASYELRLAGLLVEAVVVPGTRWLRLVYVAKLHRSFRDCWRAAPGDGPQMGSGELRGRHMEFEPTARVLIDNLSSL